MRKHPESKEGTNPILYGAIFSALVCSTLSCQQENKKTSSIGSKEIPEQVSTTSSLTPSLPEGVLQQTMDGVLDQTERNTINNLLKAYPNLKFTYNGKTLDASGAYITYNGASVPQIDFYLIDCDLGDGTLGRALPQDAHMPTSTVVLNLYEIQKYLINTCAKEIGMEVSRDEVLKMVFFEESYHLRMAQGEGDINLFMIKKLPKKFAMLKIYVMCRNIPHAWNTSGKSDVSGYLQTFAIYQKYMEKVGCKNYKDLTLPKLSQMVDMINQEEGNK